MTQAGGSGAPPARGLRRWLAGRTLRGRLIAGLVALLFAACAAVGVVTYVSLHGYLLGQLDQQLTAASARYTTCVDGPPPGGQPPGAPGAPDGDQDDQGDHQSNPMYCANTAGQPQSTFSAAISSSTLAAQITQGECKLTTADEATLRRLPVDGQPYTEKLYSLDATYRMVAQRGGNGTVLITGLPMTSVTDILKNVELTEIIVFA